MDASLPDILPCIFCAEPNCTLTANGTMHFVTCTSPECTATGPTSPDPSEAVDAWNTIVPRDGPLPFVHWTCGTSHVRAERTLQIISDVGASDIEAIAMIAGLVEESGYRNAVVHVERCDEAPF